MLVLIYFLSAHFYTVYKTPDISPFPSLPLPLLTVFKPTQNPLRICTSPRIIIGILRDKVSLGATKHVINISHLADKTSFHC